MGSKVPQIVDYYFQGARVAVREMAEALLQNSSLNGLVEGELDTTPEKVGEQLTKAVAALNRIDPHYSYGFATKPKGGDFSQVFDDFAASSSPRPLTSKFQTMGEQHVRIDIFAKTNLSTELRPIEMRTTLKAQPSSTAEGSIRDFLIFGTPLSLPEDSADVIVDAPGGLGGTISGAAISLRPHDDSKENAQELRLLLLDNKMKVIDELPLERDYISFGSAKVGKVPGAETKLVDSTGVLTVVLRSKFSDCGAAKEAGCRCASDDAVSHQH